MRISDWSSDVCSSDLSVTFSASTPRCSTTIFFTFSAESLMHSSFFDYGVNIGLCPRTQQRGLQEGWRVQRSEARRVGKECVSTCSSRWLPYNKKQHTDTL